MVPDHLTNAHEIRLFSFLHLHLYKTVQSNPRVFSYEELGAIARVRITPSRHRFRFHEWEIDTN